METGDVMVNAILRLTIATAVNGRTIFMILSSFAMIATQADSPIILKTSVPLTWTTVESVFQISLIS